MPGTWSGGRQLTSSARTPASSKWRAARPNSSPSWPPPRWPKTPQTPWGARREADPTGAEAHPDGDAAAHERLDRRERQPVADERHRLEQHQVGRVLVEHARQQLEHLAAALAVDVAVDAERERDLAGAAGALDRLAADAQPAAGDVHPVHRRRERRLGLAVELAGQPPRVRRDDVAAGVEVGAVDVAHGAGVVDERPGPPERLVAVAGRDVGPRVAELGRDAAVE